MGNFHNSRDQPTSNHSTITNIPCGWSIVCHCPHRVNLILFHRSEGATRRCKVWLKQSFLNRAS